MIENRLCIRKGLLDTTAVCVAETFGEFPLAADNYGYTVLAYTCPSGSFTLQRTVITLSKENKELNERNETLRRQLMEIGAKVGPDG